MSRLNSKKKQCQLQITVEGAQLGCHNILLRQSGVLVIIFTVRALKHLEISLFTAIHEHFLQIVTYKKMLCCVFLHIQKEAYR